MRNFTRLFLIVALVAVSITCHSQAFTVSEFVNLTMKDKPALEDGLSGKGYTFQSTVGSDMVSNEVYGASNGMTVTIMVPNFKTDEKMLSWQFSGSESLYNDLVKELTNTGFNKKDVERRSAGKYVATTYTKPGVTVTLSNDKVNNSNGVCTFSVRYSNAAWYNLK
ncbi:MAG: hypothetical protein E6772_11995 [Dysgonomonas sp.]|nr:hypothetical protein [Dysgonomonas sp.]